MVPYALDDGTREGPFTEGLRLASLYILAESRCGLDSLMATAHVYYPFQIRRWNDGVILIDLLGLNQTSFKYNLLPDIEGFEEELQEASLEPEALLKLLMKRGNLFKDFPRSRNVVIKGLLRLPDDTGELQKLLEETVDFEENDRTNVFRPALKESDIKNVFEALEILERNIQGDEETLMRGKGSLEETVATAEKVLEEEIQNIKDGSSKAVARMKGRLKKKRDRPEKKLKKDVEKIRDTFRKQAKPLREQKGKHVRRIKRLEKSIQSQRSKGDVVGVKDRRAALEEARKKHAEMDTAVVTLEEKRDSEIEELREKLRVKLKVDEDQIAEEEDRAKAEVGEKQELASQIKKEARNLSRQIEALIRRKRNRLKSMDRVLVEMDVEETEIYVPFYVFKYGNKRYDFHPPVFVGGGQGLFSRFRRMLAENIERKITLLIRPRETFIEQYIARMAKTIESRKGQGMDYGMQVEAQNLFRERRATDLIMKGLVRMRREDWINDNEYIRFQVSLVDKLDFTLDNDE
jgi:hypothetical protein